MLWHLSGQGFGMVVDLILDLVEKRQGVVDLGVEDITSLYVEAEVSEGWRRLR